MTDAAYQRALQKREELRGQLTEIEEFIRLWRRLFGNEMEEETSPQAVTGPSAPVGTDLLSNRPKRSLSRERAAEVARKVILAKGAPMTRGELVAAFQAEGEHVSGADPSRNMGTIMWRLRDRFENIEGRGYWPRDVDWPATESHMELPDGQDIESEENV